MKQNKIISNILYDEWLNSKYGNLFNQLLQNYLTLKNPRFKIFNRYEDTNFGYMTDKTFALCIGAAKFRKTQQGPYLIFLMEMFRNYRYSYLENSGFTGWMTYMPEEEETHNYTYTWDKVINPKIINVSDVKLDTFESLKKNFIKNFDLN